MPYKRDIPGFEGLYEIDREGSVWRIDAPRKRPLAPGITNGYARVVLSKDGSKKNYLVHQLVLLTFEGPCPEGLEVRHLNGIRSDNRVENLRYGTKTQNQRDRFTHGTAMFGETHPLAKLTESQVKEIRAATRGIRRLNQAYGVSRATIEAIRARRLWKHVI